MIDTLARDGVTLAYTEAGHGAPPLLFIHDRGRDHRSFAAQLAHFRVRHRTVAVDLRGRGDTPPAACTIAELADDLTWLCRELGVYRPVLVGHGLGGLVALVCATLFPKLPAALVTLDAPLLLPPPCADHTRGDVLHSTLPAYIISAASKHVARTAAPRRRAPLLHLCATPPAGLDDLRALWGDVSVERLAAAGPSSGDASARLNAAIGRFLATLPAR